MSESKNPISKYFSEIHFVKIPDTRFRERTFWQNVAIVLVYIINTIMIGINCYITAFYYQNVISEFTYFRGGTTTCERYYGMNLARWLYLFVAVNFIDNKISMNTGENTLGTLTLPSNIISIFMNGIILIISLIAYLPTCNMDGFGDTGNICQDRRFCGVSNFTSNVNNNCAVYNPSLLPLCSGLTSDKLTVDYDYIIFLILLCVLFILGIAKLILSFALSETLSFYSSIFKSAKNAYEKLKKSELPTFEIKEDVPKQIKFLRIYKSSRAILYVPVEVFDIIIGLMLLTWLGWFQQNVHSTTYDFVVDIGGTCTNFVVSTDYSKQVFFVFVGLLIIPWISFSKIGTLFENWIAIVGSLWGVVHSVILIVWLFYYGLGCQGNATNICSDKRMCSARFEYGLANTLASNKCPNSYTCPVILSKSELAPNEDYVYLCVIIGLFLALSLVIFIYTVVLEIEKKKHMNTKEEVERKEELDTENYLRTKVEQINHYNEFTPEYQNQPYKELTTNEK